MIDEINQLESPKPGPATAEAVARRLIEEGFNRGLFDVADELIADDLVEHQDYGPNHASGPAGVKAVMASLRRAFADFHLSIEHLAIQGELVWLRNVATGTHAGSYMGRQATGRPIRVEVFDLLRVRAGKIVEHWGVPDRLGALRQIEAETPGGT